MKAICGFIVWNIPSPPSMHWLSLVHWDKLEITILSYTQSPTYLLLRPSPVIDNTIIDERLLSSKGESVKRKIHLLQI